MEYAILILVAAIVGYMFGRQRAREQVFRQIYGMHFLSTDQQNTLRSFLINRSGRDS